MALSISGAVMQGIFRNPLADPSRHIGILAYHSMMALEHDMIDGILIELKIF